MRSFFKYFSHFLGMVLLIGVGFYLYLNYHFKPTPIEIVYDNIFLDENIESQREITVTGAVNQPGTYFMPPGAIMADLIQRAGDFAIEADLSAVNPAQLIEDTSIFIPAKSTDYQNILLENDQTTNSPLTNQPETVDVKININSAGLEQLISLPGIGEKTAEKIIEYRLNNKFDSIKEIMDVNGIGEGKFSQIENLITV